MDFGYAVTFSVIRHDPETIHSYQVAASDEKSFKPAFLFKIINLTNFEFIIYLLVFMLVRSIHYGT